MCILKATWNMVTLSIRKQKCTFFWRIILRLLLGLGGMTVWIITAVFKYICVAQYYLSYIYTWPKCDKETCIWSVSLTLIKQHNSERKSLTILDWITLGFLIKISSYDSSSEDCEVYQLYTSLLNFCSISYYRLNKSTVAEKLKCISFFLLYY